MESFTFIQWCLENLNYWTVTLLMTIESSFIPFPSEIVVAPAAYNAAAGELNVILVVVFATLGACIGAIINYMLSVWIGRPIVYKFADSKVGHLCLLSGEKVAKAEEYFKQHGIISTLIGRLIPGIRQLISIPAGLSRMNFGTFIAFTALGAGVWNAFLAALGYYLHSLLPKEQLMDTVYKYSHEIGYTILAIVAALIAFLILKNVLKKSHDSSPR